MTLSLDKTYRLHVLELESKIDDVDKTTPFEIDWLVAFVRAASEVDITKRLCFYQVKPDEDKLRSARAHFDRLLAKTLVDKDMTLAGGGKHEHPVNSRLIHAILGIATEAGELVEELLEALCDNRQINFDALHEELGDHKYYFELMLDAAEQVERQGRFTHECIMSANIAKLRHRYRPGVKLGDERDYAAERQAADQAIVDALKASPSEMRQMEG